MKQAVDRLEDAGYASYDDGLTVVDERVHDAARELVAASAGVSPPSIEEAYIIPQFGDWPFAFTRIDAQFQSALAMLDRMFLYVLSKQIVPVDGQIGCRRGLCWRVEAIGRIVHPHGPVSHCHQRNPLQHDR